MRWKPIQQAEYVFSALCGGLTRDSLSACKEERNGKPWCFNALVNPHRALLPGTAIPLNELLSWPLPWAVENAQLMNGVRMGPGATRPCLVCLQQQKKNVCRAPVDKKGLHSYFQRPEHTGEWQGSEIQTPDNGKAGNIKERKFFCCIAFPMAIR